MAGDWRAGVVDDLRSLINEGAPGVDEEAKWKKPTNPDGVPTFSRDGILCTLETYKDKVKLTFAKGASLDDPAGIFNASLDAGTRRRGRTAATSSATSWPTTGSRGRQVRNTPCGSASSSATVSVGTPSGIADRSA